MADGLSQLDQRIEQFESLLEQMREATREAHSVLKQIRIERKEIDHIMLYDTKKLVDDRLGALVKAELDKVGPELREQTSKIYARVTREVDKLIDISLGREFSMRNGREDLRPQLAEKLKLWLIEVIEEE